MYFGCILYNLYNGCIIGVFLDHRNVSSVTELTILADLFYESNRDGNVNIYAKDNFNSRSNQYFKPKNLSMPSDNSESHRNCVNTLSGDKKPEWVAQKSEKPVAFRIRCFHCRMLNHRRSQCFSQG